MCACALPTARLVYLRLLLHVLSAGKLSWYDEPGPASPCPVHQKVKIEITNISCFSSHIFLMVEVSQQNM